MFLAEKVPSFIRFPGMPGNSTWIGFFPQGFLAAIPTIYRAYIGISHRGTLVKGYIQIFPDIHFCQQQESTLENRGGREMQTLTPKKLMRRKWKVEGPPRWNHVSPNSILKHLAKELAGGKTWTKQPEFFSLKVFLCGWRWCQWGGGWRGLGGWGGGFLFFFWEHGVDALGPSFAFSKICLILNFLGRHVG